MTKDFFISQLPLYEKLAEAAANDLQKLKDDYIAANRVIEDGERVKVVTKAHNGYSCRNGEEKIHHYPETVRYAYCVGVDLWRDEIRYKLVKEKKDGTPSKVSDYYGGHHVIVKIAENGK